MPNIIEITDFSAPELDVYARLTENQLVCRRDPTQALFIAESPVVIERALDAGCVPVSFLMETKHAAGKGRALIARCGEETGALVTAENHNIYGGLGSAVAETAAKTVPVPIEMVGTDDRFGQVGTEAFLRAEYRLNAAHIVESAKRAIERK